MKLYSASLSLFAKKVEVVLSEKNVEHERVLVPFSQTQGYAPKHPEILAHSPKGQVPLLVDDDLTLYDSTVIIEYLEDAFPQPPLFPSTAKERARCRKLELFADEIVLVALHKLMHRNEPGARERDDWTQREERAATGEVALSEHTASLAEELGGETYFCGDFSVADIAIFLQLLYAQRLGGPSLKPHPALLAWYRTVGARPSVAPVVEETLAADAKLSAPVAGAFKDGR